MIRFPQQGAARRPAGAQAQPDQTEARLDAHLMLSPLQDAAQRIDMVFKPARGNLPADLKLSIENSRLGVVGRVGFEPTTLGLKVRCTAAVLPACAPSRAEF
jgi:hypothetical protein